MPQDIRRREARILRLAYIRPWPTLPALAPMQSQGPFRVHPAGCGSCAEESSMTAADKEVSEAARHNSQSGPRALRLFGVGKHAQSPSQILGTGVD